MKYRYEFKKKKRNDYIFEKLKSTSNESIIVIRMSSRLIYHIHKTRTKEKEQNAHIKMRFTQIENGREDRQRPNLCNFSECKLNWYYYDGTCVYKCPRGTYGVSDESKAVCSNCHYSCLTCSGPSNTECTSCHEDAEFSSSLDESVCILRDLSWTMHSTLWFYWMTILFSISVLLFIVIIVYVGVKWYLKNRNSYRYSKVSSSNNGDAHKDILQNGYISDSE